MCDMLFSDGIYLYMWVYKQGAKNAKCSNELLTFPLKAQTYPWWEHFQQQSIVIIIAFQLCNVNLTPVVGKKPTVSIKSKFNKAKFADALYIQYFIFSTLVLTLMSSCWSIDALREAAGCPGRLKCSPCLLFLHRDWPVYLRIFRQQMGNTGRQWALFTVGGRSGQWA